MLLYLFDPTITEDDIKYQIIQKLSSSDNISDLKKLYQNELIQHKDVKNKDLLDEIEKENYTGSMIDLPLLANLLDINILVLHSRITKMNPKAFNLFLTHKSNKKDYIILYSYKQKGEKNKLYSIIKIKPHNDIILNERKIPRVLRKYIFDDISNSSVSSSSNE